MNCIIITGASSGIGQEFARQLDALFSDMDEIWLIARREERLETLSRELRTMCRIISMDLTKANEMELFGELLKKRRPCIRVLVNSAGFGLMGAVETLSLQEQTEMIRLNCTALTEMTYRCLPYMKKNSRIVQMASSAAFLPQKNFAVYAATKAYVLSFSQALREELRVRGICVTSVCPGPVDTEFFDRAEQYGKTLAVKKMTIVSAKRVVRQAVRDVCDRKAMSVCSFPIQAFRILCKILPQRVILRVMELLG